jgi:hypothetical protein
MLESPPLPHCFSSDHEQFRAVLREFVASDTPFVEVLKDLAARQLEF